VQFEDIIGQQKQTAALQATIEKGRIPHAQLIEGKDGQGLLSLALAYANSVVCGTYNTENAGWLKAKKLVHPDIHFVFPTTTTTEIKSKPSSEEFLAQWRAFVFEHAYGSEYDWAKYLGVENKQGVINVTDALQLIKKVSLTSFEGGWKCVLIWHAEKMTTAAANKLLKSIEEPPAKTLFLLLCPDQNQLLSTIRSRCQCTTLSRIPTKDISDALVHGGATKEVANSLAKQASGNLGIALEQLQQQEELIEFEDWFVTWVRTAFKAKGNKAVVLELTEWSRTIASKGVETQKQFLAYAIGFFRSALMEHYRLEELKTLIPKGDFKLSKFAPYIHGGNIVSIIRELEKSNYHLERNGNAQMVFTSLSFNLTRLLHQKAI
jgi:DNA polymerase-3 subunit delta'